MTEIYVLQQKLSQYLFTFSLAITPSVSFLLTHTHIPSPCLYTVAYMCVRVCLSALPFPVLGRNILLSPLHICL